MKIGVIGMGHVGRAAIEVFGQHAEMVTYDVGTDDQYPDRELEACEFALVCVGTPMREDGSCDTTQVFEAVKRLSTERILLRSTVPPGTTDALAAETGKDICFSPEYFGESAYSSQFRAEGPGGIPFMIVGGTEGARRPLIALLTEMLGPDKVYFQCTAKEAEIIKYMENSYLATKVTFVNEFFEICKAFDADWLTVREGWLLDPRVERSHTAVFERDRGFGGRCLPKDVNAIISASSAAGYQPALMMQVIESNALFRSRTDGFDQPNR